MDVIADIVLCVGITALLIRSMDAVLEWRWRRKTLRRLDEIARETTAAHRMGQEARKTDPDNA